MPRLTRYKIIKPFTWDGRELGRGDHLELPDDHPRIGSMVKHRYMVYDPEKVNPA